MQTKFLNVISSLIEILEDSILILEGLKCKLRANSSVNLNPNNKFVNVIRFLCAIVNINLLNLIYSFCV